MNSPRLTLIGHIFIRFREEPNITVGSPKIRTSVLFNITLLELMSQKHRQSVPCSSFDLHVSYSTNQAQTQETRIVVAYLRPNDQ